VEKLRILISEGNEQTDRAIFSRFNGCAPSGMFDRIFKNIRSDVDTEIFLATDAGQRPSRPLEEYDGILFTGSNSNIYRMTDGTKRQIAFAQSAFGSGTPMFGVCWGLQLATVAAGGDVQPSQATDCRCEAPIAFGVSLTDQGKDHPMHHGRPQVFDTFGFHSDQVVRLPENAKVTARNRHFIQAIEITRSRSTFWGVQFHPELSGPDTAGFMRGSMKELVDGGLYTAADGIEKVAQALDRFSPDRPLDATDRRLLGGVDHASFEFRPLEIINWLDRLVIPTREERRRAAVALNHPSLKFTACDLGHRLEEAVT
jgi:GMP synthase (glutamine-hydrolysing)